MNLKIVLIVFTLLAKGCGPGQAPASPGIGSGSGGGGSETSLQVQTVSVPSLGIDLYAVLRTKKSTNLIIFLHQEGSNLHEADDINSQLADKDFDTLSVDLRYGGTAFGFDNQTVKALGGTNPSFQLLTQDVHSTVTWATNQQYAVIILTGSSQGGSAAIEEASRNFSVRKIAAFSPPTYVGGDEVYNYASQIFKPFFVAAPSSEKQNIDTLVSGTLATYLVRDTNQDGGHGFLLLKNKVVLQEYLAFLSSSL